MPRIQSSLVVAKVKPAAIEPTACRARKTQLRVVQGCLSRSSPRTILVSTVLMWLGQVCCCQGLNRFPEHGWAAFPESPDGGFAVSLFWVFASELPALLSGHRV